VYPWHYRWTEYQTMMSALKRFIPVQQPDQTLVVYGSYRQDFIGCRYWLQHKLHIKHHYLIKSLSHSPDTIKALQSQQFASCVMIESMQGMQHIQRSLAVVREIMGENAAVLLLILNDSEHISRMSQNFQVEFIHRISSLANTHYQIANVTSIHNQLTQWGAKIAAGINQTFSHSKKLRFLAYILIGAPLSLLTLVYNSMAGLMKGKGHCTTILVTLTAEKRRGL
jgi:hypothetical protein